MEHAAPPIFIFFSMKKGEGGGHFTNFHVLDTDVLAQIEAGQWWTYPQISLIITHCLLNCRYRNHHVCLEQGCLQCLDCARREPCRALATVFAVVLRKLREIRQVRRSDVCLRSIGVFVETGNIMSLQPLETVFLRSAMEAIGQFPFPCAVTMPAFNLVNNYDILGNVHTLYTRSITMFGADLVAETNLQQLFLYGMMDRSPRDKVSIANNILRTAANGRWLSEEDLRPISEDLAYALRHQRDLIARKHNIFLLIWFARRQPASVWFRMPKDVMLLMFSFIRHKDWIKNDAAEEEITTTKRRRHRAITAKKPTWATDVIKEYRELLRHREMLALNKKELAETKKEQKNHEEALAALPKIIERQTLITEESACTFEAAKTAFFENRVKK